MMLLNFSETTEAIFDYKYIGYFITDAFTDLIGYVAAPRYPLAWPSLSAWLRNCFILPNPEITQNKYQ